MPLKILNAEPDQYSPAARQVLESFGEVVERDCSREELLGLLPEFDVLIARLRFKLDRQVLDAGTRLKALVSATTGLDHIDLDYAGQKGVRVLSLRGEVEFLRSIPATAEHTWGLLLGLVRHIPQAYGDVLEGRWQRDAFRGRDLCGKKLGILGLGRIGEKVARYAAAFGMEVGAYDPYRGEWPAGVKRMPGLDELLGWAEVFSIHVPLNPETRGMIGGRELELLPAGAWLVNTARGGILDETALLAGLESGRLGGAALDVLENENSAGLDPHNRLLGYARSHANLLLTPHIGGATDESMAGTEIFMAKKLKKFSDEN